MKTAGGLEVTAGLVYPRQGHDPRLVAYAWFKLEDGHGFSVFIKSARLMVDDLGNYYVQLPSEPKKMWCKDCRKQNADNANYCNWCGQPQAPRDPKPWMMDVLVPTNPETRKALVDVAVAEHDRRQPPVPS